MRWVIDPLCETNDVSAFDCGEARPNSFLQKHALNNNRADLGRTYMASASVHAPFAGYYTVSTGSVTFGAAPDYSRKRLPKYPIPTVHVGRLAVDVRVQRRGLGEVLLVEALQKAAVVSLALRR